MKKNYPAVALAVNGAFKVKESHEVASALSQLVELSHDRIHFVCIGTDRSTGDSLGPMIGSKLKKMGYNVSGTIHDPVHAMNLDEELAKVPEGMFVIGIDACLGRVDSIGLIQAGKGPVRPGAGVNKHLTPVGDIHITGIVNVGGFMEYFVLQNTRLSLVMDMADIIVKGIKQAIPRKSQRVVYM